MALSTSLLVAFQGFAGKLDAYETFMTTLLFNIGWPLSYMSSGYIFKNWGPGNTYKLYDGYGTNYVFVFAGCFGLIVSLILNCKPSPFKLPARNTSSFFTLIGTGFAFATFPYVGDIFPWLTASTSSNFIRRNEGPLNIYFAMTASVIMVYVSGAIFGGKAGIRDAFIGVLTGGVTIGVVADVVPNIGATIAIGAWTGFFSGFWMRVIHPRINRTNDIDHLGLFGPILINSILGGLVLAPAFFQAFYASGLQPSNFTATITTVDVMKYQLAYIGVAAGTGLVFGLLVGIVTVSSRSKNYDFKYNKIINEDFGLCPA